MLNTHGVKLSEEAVTVWPDHLAKSLQPYSRVQHQQDDRPSYGNNLSVCQISF